MVTEELKPTLVINIFGTAGSGKTETANQIVNELKQKGYTVDFAPSLACELFDTMHDPHATSVQKNLAEVLLRSVVEDQLTIAIEQQKRIEKSIGLCDFVVTDSPVLQGVLYMDRENTTDYFKARDYMVNCECNPSTIYNLPSSCFNIATEKCNNSHELNQLFDQFDIWVTRLNYFHTLNRTIDDIINTYQNVNQNMLYSKYEKALEVLGNNKFVGYDYIYSYLKEPTDQCLYVYDPEWSCLNRGVSDIYDVDVTGNDFADCSPKEVENRIASLNEVALDVLYPTNHKDRADIVRIANRISQKPEQYKLVGTLKRYSNSETGNLKAQAKTAKKSLGKANTTQQTQTKDKQTNKQISK